MRQALLLAVLSLVIGCRAHSGRASGEGAPGAVEAGAEHGGSGPPVADAELLRVQKRARYIVESEQGAIRATDLLLERKDVDRARMQWFFTVPRGNAWYSVFGKLDAQGRFVPSYAYRAPIEFSDQMEDFPVESLPEGFDAIARAVSAASERTFQVHGRKQINPIVLEEEDGITVYVVQGLTDPEYFLLGGDFRFRFSPDGRTLREEVPLHQGLIPVDLRPDEKGSRPEYSVHSHVLFPGPVETELAMVMLYPQLGGVFVGNDTQDCVYGLTPDGTIRVLRLSRSELLRELRPDGTFVPAVEVVERVPGSGPEPAGVWAPVPPSAEGPPEG